MLLDDILKESKQIDSPVDCPCGKVHIYDMHESIGLGVFHTVGICKLCGYKEHVLIAPHMERPQGVPGVPPRPEERRVFYAPNPDLAKYYRAEAVQQLRTLIEPVRMKAFVYATDEAGLQRSREVDVITEPVLGAIREFVETCSLGTVEELKRQIENLPESVTQHKEYSEEKIRKSLKPWFIWLRLLKEEEK